MVPTHKCIAVSDGKRFRRLRRVEQRADGSAVIQFGGIDVAGCAGAGKCDDAGGIGKVRVNVDLKRTRHGGFGNGKRQSIFVSAFGARLSRRESHRDRIVQRNGNVIPFAGYNRFGNGDDVTVHVGNVPSQKLPFGIRRQPKNRLFAYRIIRLNVADAAQIAVCVLRSREIQIDGMLYHDRMNFHVLSDMFIAGVPTGKAISVHTHFAFVGIGYVGSVHAVLDVFFPCRSAVGIEENNGKGLPGEYSL